MSDDIDDSYTETTQQGWLQRLVGSFVAAFIGLLLVLGSFVLLYWNEGRAVADITSLNAGARSVLSIPATPVDAAHDGQLVHVTGSTVLSGTAADPLFHVAPPDAVRLRRHVQEYQWEEHEETETEKHLGGSQTTRKTYTYRKVWSETPINASGFKRPAGHGNPAMPLRTVVSDAAVVKIGALRLDGSLVDQLSTFKPAPAGRGQRRRGGTEFPPRG